MACLDPLTSRAKADMIATFGCTPVPLQGQNKTLNVTCGVHSMPDWSASEGEALSQDGNTDGPEAMHEPTDEILPTQNDSDTEDATDSDESLNMPGPAAIAAAIFQPTPSISSMDPTDHSAQSLHSKENSALGTHDGVRLPFNLLQANAVDISLVTDMYYYPDDLPGHKHKDSHASRIISARPLCQKLAPEFSHLSEFERMNMIHQIPELGITVIASQIGRVGILSATRREPQGQYGFKIEYILPFKSQEAERLRPKDALMGIAVGPIQGHLNPPEPGSAEDVSEESGAGSRPVAPRRFRLLMVYAEHTVLSYEISRPNGSEILVI